MIPWRFYWILPEYSWNVLSALILFLLVWIQFVVPGLTCSWKSCDFAAEVIELCGHLTLTPTFSFSSTFSVQVHCKKKKNPLLQTFRTFSFLASRKKKNLTKWLWWQDLMRVSSKSGLCGAQCRPETGREESMWAIKLHIFKLRG